MKDVTDAIRRVRAVKSAHEIELIREAARLADRVAAAVPGLLRAGMSEVALAGQIEAEARRLGHQGIVRMRLWGAELFYGHLMCGANAAEPSYLASPTGGRSLGPAVAQGPSEAKIESNAPILVDYVFARDGYLADHTRIFVIGRLPEDLRRAHAAMITLQDELAARMRPGVLAGEVYDWAVTRAAQLGYAEWFIGRRSGPHPLCGSRGRHRTGRIPVSGGRPRHAPGRRDGGGPGTEADLSGPWGRGDRKHPPGDRLGP